MWSKFYEKIFFAFVFISAFFLCSCDSSLPAETNTAPSQTNTDSPTGANFRSIVFMEENITAPDFYPGVPEIYKPLLDNLCLYGKLLYRYTTLNYEDKITPEAKSEYERIQNEIAQREPRFTSVYSSSVSGYSLLDLDNDNSPELLLLSNSSGYFSYSQNAAVHFIFTVRNGELVCVKNGSYKFQNHTILADNNIFYQCVNYEGTGYTDLTAFRLKPGMSELTIISEAHASLSFSDGDVPVPYWFKKENGKEIHITEEEFDLLFE